LADWFAAELAAAEQRIDAFPAARAGELYRPGGWTRQQVLGHLVDSAINNHVRFAGAATNPRFEMLFGYEADGWVDVHGYAAMTWADVVRHWKTQNELLLQVVPRVPPAQVLRAGDTVWTMEQWMRDYIRHLHHHVAQIVA